MKCVIAGSRDIDSYEIVRQAIINSGFTISEVVSGAAAGVDRLGEYWAQQNNIPFVRFLPDWEKYGKRAGYVRNKQMVEYVAPDGAVIAIWNGSKGTKSTIDLAKEYKVKLYIEKI